MHPVVSKRSLTAVVAMLLSFSALALRALAADPLPPHPAPPVPAVLLVPPTDSTPLDKQILSAQVRLKTTIVPGAELERLGWLYVAKARASSDPGFYTLAGIAADSLEKDFNLPQEGWLLRGHVLQTRHRFAEAEALARKLVAARGDASDYALLGDALYDQGDSAGAATAYQQFVDIKPGLEAYTRGANIRWLRGDLPGAIELQTMAVRAGSANDPAALAWSLVRLGNLVWTQGQPDVAAAEAARAGQLVNDFPPALLLEGRLLISAGRAKEALVPLARAAAILPLPEPRWVYAEALRAAGQEAEAKAEEELMVREGIAEDPRTVAVFLSTRGMDPATALQLTSAELTNRADVMTHAANALALAQAGRIDEALPQARAALAEGTIDAHLLLQVGRVFALAHAAGAADLLDRAGKLSPVLLPSELKLLADSRARLPAGPNLLANASLPTNTHPNETIH